jgi:DNA-binding transcriptional LysR family regulator
MDRFHEMQIFVRIMERRSFTQAAEDLQVPRATVTNIIKRLEERLGTRLLERTNPRSMARLTTSAACACSPTWKRPRSCSATLRPKACCA